MKPFSHLQYVIVFPATLTGKRPITQRHILHLHKKVLRHAVKKRVCSVFTTITAVSKNDLICSYFQLHWPTAHSCCQRLSNASASTAIIQLSTGKLFLMLAERDRDK